MTDASRSTAGRGVADAASLIEAVRMARRLAA